MTPDDKIFVSGHCGMVGQALCRALAKRGYSNLVKKTSKELDLRDQDSTADFFKTERPDVVIHAAAKVGGVMANMQAPADFLYENLMIQSNVIVNSQRFGVKQLLFIGSNSVYPAEIPQPIREESLLTGKIDAANEGYSLAKIVGVKMCELFNRQYHTNFSGVLACNLYGYNDSFDLVRAHVVPGLIRRFYEAKQKGLPTVEVWGTGNARRELMFAEDFADGCIFLLENDFEEKLFNMGPGEDVSIRELAETVANIVGYNGRIVFNAEKPDGIARKLLDVRKINSYGWHTKTSLYEGIQKTYQWFLENVAGELKP